MDDLHSLKEIRLVPVGRVRNGITSPMSFEDWQQIDSEIIIEPKFGEALDGVEEYSHLVVIYYFHRRGEETPEGWKVHPKGRVDLPLVGIFATRSQFRPNPLGLSTPRLLARVGNTLRVRGLDALDGTPVIDIKGVSPRRDWPADLVVPDWVYRL